MDDIANFKASAVYRPSSLKDLYENSQSWMQFVYTLKDNLWLMGVIWDEY